MESVRLPDAAELLREEKGTDGDSEGEASRVRACQYLEGETQWKAEGGGAWVSSTEGRKRKRATKSASMVDSREEGVAGSSKRVKLEITGPAEGEGMSSWGIVSLFSSSGLLVIDFRFRALYAGAVWIVPDVLQSRPPKNPTKGRLAPCCKVKKSACSFNKGTTSSLVISSEEISEVLQTWLLLSLF